MATLLTPELGQRRSRPLIRTAILPLTMLAIVVAALLSFGLANSSTLVGVHAGSASEAVGSAAAGLSAAALVPSAEALAFGSTDGCDRLGISGDLVGEQASPHEVFKASLDLCLAK